MMNILIVDDHEMIGELFATLVKQHFAPVKVFVATSLRSGIEILENHTGEPFSIALIDLVIEGESEGAGTVRSFRNKFPSVPVLAISGLDAHAVASKVYEQGVQGFLSKFCSSEELIQAIRCVLRGDQFFLDGLHRALSSVTPVSKPRLVDLSTVEAPALSDRQLAILELLSSGFSDKGVAKKLGITDETVAYHLQKVFRTLNASTRTQAIAQAFRHGLLAVNRFV
jgi:two-component system, NarL family, competent response regulator ComA